MSEQTFEEALTNLIRAVNDGPRIESDMLSGEMPDARSAVRAAHAREVAAAKLAGRLERALPLCNYHRAAVTRWTEAVKNYPEHCIECGDERDRLRREAGKEG